MIHWLKRGFPVNANSPNGLIQYAILSCISYFMINATSILLSLIGKEKIVDNI